MANYLNFYQTEKAFESSGFIEQLLQLLRIVWDGDLVDKSARDKLVEDGMAIRANGFNMITPKGVGFLVDEGFLHP